MLPIQNFAFDDSLVRVVMRGDDPWFAGKDVCHALGIAKHHQALERLDQDERGTCTVGTPSGEQSMIVVCEAGVYRLAFTSRKEEAKRFTRWVAHEVLPSIRRTGHYGTPPAADEAQIADRSPDGPLYKLNLVREARLLFGAERARWLWRHLGLPAVPPPPPTALDEARQCLRHLLDAPAFEGGPMIRDLLEPALNDYESERATLIGAGIRVLPERDGFMVANMNRRLVEIFAGTEWGKGAWSRVIRRLPGTTPTGPYRFDGHQQRGTFVAADLLDEDRELRARTGKGVALPH